MLALELAERTRRSELTGREYTVAEHAVILSTYVSPHLAVSALLIDACKLKLVDRPLHAELRVELAAAERRLARDESGIAFLPALHAAHVFVTRCLELGVTL